MDRSSIEAITSSGTDNGWPDELEVVYRSSFESFVRLAAVLIGQRGEAEEVVHDAFVKAAPRLIEIENVGAYVRRSVINGAYAVLRRRRVTENHRLDPPPVEAPPQLIEFRDVLMSLSWNQRSVIVLRFLEGLSVRETAEILDCRESTVRSHSRRGLKALRRELSP